MQVGFALLGTQLDSAARQLMGLSDLEIINVGTRQFIVAAGEADAGLTSYEIMNNGSLVVRDDLLFDAGSGTGNVRGLTSYVANGVTYVIPMGRYDDNMSVYSVDASGAFTLEDSYFGGGFSNLVASVAVQIGGATVFFSATTAAGLDYYTVNLAGDFVSPQAMNDNNSTALGDVAVLETGFLQGKTFLFVASSFDTGLAVYTVSASGNTTQTYYLEPGVVGFNAPMAIATMQIGPRAFVLMASAETDTLLVFRVSVGGKLNLVDSMIDVSETRFSRVSVLEPFEKGGRQFLLAAGSDDGITLFEVDYRGRLKFLEVVADEFDTTLDNISDIEVTEINGEYYVFVSSPTESGFTQFLLNLDFGTTFRGGPVQDTITGTSGDDTIFGHGMNDILDGGAGDDRLIDGRGRDILTGGTGADVFEFIADGLRDWITDFEIGVDRLDLSDYDGLYSFRDLDIRARPDGVVIRIGEEILSIRSYDGQPINVSEWSQTDFIFG